MQWQGMGCRETSDMEMKKIVHRMKCQTCYHAKVTVGEMVYCQKGFVLGPMGYTMGFPLPLKRIGYKKTMPCKGLVWEDAEK